MSNAGYNGRDDISLLMVGFPGGRRSVFTFYRREPPVISTELNTTAGIAVAQTAQSMLPGVMAGEVGSAQRIVVTG
jgi:hypothetical protein